MNAVAEIFAMPTFLIHFSTRHFITCGPEQFFPRICSLWFDEAVVQSNELPRRRSIWESAWSIIYYGTLLTVASKLPSSYLFIFFALGCWQFQQSAGSHFLKKLPMYSKPFVRFGETVTVASLRVMYSGYRCCFQPPLSYEQCILLADCIVHIVSVYQQWCSVGQQYKDKLRLCRREGGVDAIVLQKARELLQFDAEVCVLSVDEPSAWPLQIQGPMSEMMLKGTEYCVEFLSQRLAKALKETWLVELILANPSQPWPQEKCIPLYKQWQLLEVVQDAVTTLTGLQRTCENRGSARTEWVVNGATRIEMQKGLKLLEKRKHCFVRLTNMVLGEGHGQHPVNALLQADRELKGGSLSRSWSSGSLTRRVPASERASSPSALNAISGEPTAVQQVVRNDVVSSDQHMNNQPAMLCTRNSESAASSNALREPSEQAVRSLASTPSAAEAAACDDVASVQGIAAGTGSSQSGHDEEGAECICCFERPAIIVFTTCGHLVYCKQCRRKALKCAVGSEASRIRSYSRLLRRRMPCPLCRQESSTCGRDQYDSHVYVP